jgi:hypothetical protein
MPRIHNHCLIKHHAIKTYWGSGGTDPGILDLGTGWKRVVIFTPRSLYPRYPLDGRLGGPQIQSVGSGGEKNPITAHAGN